MTDDQHSCRPNLEWAFSRRRQPGGLREVRHRAIKDITAGEELFVFYGDSYCELQTDSNRIGLWSSNPQS